MIKPLRYTVLLPGMLASLVYGDMPQPAPLVLQLPHGQSMNFVPVEVSDNPNIFSLRSFNMGSGRFINEPVTRAKLAGTLFRDGKWYIPFGETEVTQGQYAAVMGSPPPPVEEMDLPQANVSFSDVQAFLVRLNRCMVQDKQFMQRLAPYRNEKSSSCFFRLPTETEWEFAARGGANVAEDIFDGDCPYPGDLAKFEVFFSSKTRTPAARKVKGARLPNPVGLYDMLGNVAELMNPTYQFEYQHGRSGGLLSRGGHFMTEESEVRSTCRNEYAPYQETGEEFRSDMVGFRPVIGSTIRNGSMSMKQFSQEWDAHVQDRVPPPPVPTATTEVCIEDLIREYKEERRKLEDEISRLKEHDSSARPADGIAGTARRMGTRMDEALALVRQSHKRSAEAGMMMVGTSCAHLALYAYQSEQIALLMKEPGVSGEAVQSKHKEIQQNMRGAESLLLKGCRLLADVPADVVKEEETRQLNILAQENPFQGECLKRGLQYCMQFRQNGQFPDLDSLKNKLLMSKKENMDH